MQYRQKLTKKIRTAYKCTAHEYEREGQSKIVDPIYIDTKLETTIYGFQFSFHV